MAKAILEFDLTDPDDRHDFAVASRAKDLLLALDEIADKLRRRVKYADEATEPKLPGLEEAREILWAVVKEYDVGSLMV